jgi:hypothetical protein
MVVAFPTGHAPVKQHMNIMGLFDGDPYCRLCKLETETVLHVIYVARPSLASVVIPLGSSLLNPKR